MRQEQTTVGEAIEHTLTNLVGRLCDYGVTQPHLDARHSRLVGTLSWSHRGFVREPRKCL